MAVTGIGTYDKSLWQYTKLETKRAGHIRMEYKNYL